uniref:Uncharacterized protein n=1 Tax=Romanomermis culicivorax TaxID=13658 RepID=A0A915IX11_ROMCU
AQKREVSWETIFITPTHPVYLKKASYESVHYFGYRGSDLYRYHVEYGYSDLPFVELDGGTMFHYYVKHGGSYILKLDFFYQ